MKIKKSWRCRLGRHGFIIDVRQIDAWATDMIAELGVVVYEGRCSECGADVVWKEDWP